MSRSPTLHRAAALLLALAALTCTAACRSSTAPANVLLIVVDTLRADRIGAGETHGLSPALDRLAATSTVFLRAYSVTSWTNPSMAALFTGQVPRTFQPGAPRFIDSEQDTLAEVMRAAGYRTAGIVANPVLGPHQGFGDGFEMYEGLAGWTTGFEHRPKADARRVTDSALAWVSQQRVGGGPWLLYLHYMDPHWPYEPDSERLRPLWKGDLPDAAAIQEINRQVRARQYSPASLALARRLYDASVATVDAEIGRLLDGLQRLGALEQSVVAVASDHGEELGDHGDVLHAHTLYDEVLRVPLIVRIPGTSPRQLWEPVQITHLGRTLLDAAGLAAAAFPGRSLLGDGAAAPVQAQLHAGPKSGHRTAVIDGTAKLVATYSERMLLFDLAADPGEQHDLGETRPDLLRRLQGLLPAPPARGMATDKPTDPAIAERLRALGYDF